LLVVVLAVAMLASGLGPVGSFLPGAEYLETRPAEAQDANRSPLGFSTPSFTASLLTFEAEDDAADEPTETLTLELGTLPSAVAKGSPDHVDISIVDLDDDPEISLAPPLTEFPPSATSPLPVVASPIIEGKPVVVRVISSPAVQYDLPVNLSVADAAGGPISSQPTTRPISL